MKELPKVLHQQFAPLGSLAETQQGLYQAPTRVNFCIRPTGGAVSLHAVEGRAAEVSVGRQPQHKASRHFQQGNLIGCLGESPGLCISLSRSLCLSVSLAVSHFLRMWRAHLSDMPLPSAFIWLWRGLKSTWIVFYVETCGCCILFMDLLHKSLLVLREMLTFSRF